MKPNKSQQQVSETPRDDVYSYRSEKKVVVLGLQWLLPRYLSNFSVRIAEGMS